MTKKPERKSRITMKALYAIAAGSLPKGYRGPFNLDTGMPVTRMPGGRMSDGRMPLACTLCEHKWTEPQLLPMEMGAWLTKLQKLKCPNCGAIKKHLQVLFGSEAERILDHGMESMG